MADQSYLTWPFLDDEHRSLKQKFEAWAGQKEDLWDGHHQDVDQTCRDLVKTLGDAGWLQHCVPAAYGGANDNLDVRSLCLMREGLAYHSGLADFTFAMQGLGSGAISVFGTEAQKQAYLPAVATGQKIAAFALSEKEAGSDVAALATTAEETEDGFLLNGEKTWISNGGIADFYVVFARTGGAPGAKGLSAFIVDANTDGLSIAERIDVIAPHPLATLRFENCFVPKSAQIGSNGDGFRIAMATLDIFRSTVGAAALGFARRALDEALNRTTTRQLFGAPLSDMQMTQGALAEMALDVDMAALLVFRAAWAKDMGQERVTREAAMAKYHATESAQKVIDKALQFFGGQGVVSGEMVEQLYREIRALRIYEGASEVQKIIIARQLLTTHSGQLKG
ncbi:MAG: acyl-CoA dehydrogenase family protein [Sphingomonadales bacterium]